MLSSYFSVARCAAVALLSVCSLRAATYYVDSVNGNDGNNGTALPWKTISRVNNAYFNPGDQVLLNRGDVWYEALVLNSSGSAGKPITIGAYGNGSAPVLDEQGVRSPAIAITGLSYITLDGLQIQNSSQFTVTVHNSSNVTVQSCSIRNSASHGIFADGISPNLVANHNVYSMDPGFVMYGTFIVARTAVDSFTATYNTAYLNDNNTNNGIITLDVNNAVIAYNTIYNGTEAIGIKGYTRPVSNGQIYGNVVYNTSNAHGDGESLELNGSSSSTQAQGSIHHNFVAGGAHLDNAIAAVYCVNSSVYNNIVIGPALDSGIHLTSYSANVSVYGNTVYNVPCGVLVDTQSQVAITNNIVVGASYHQFIVGSGAEATEDYNLLYQCAPSFGVSSGAHTKVADPMFVSSSPATANDFHLQANSPAVESGASLGAEYDMALDPLISCFPCGTVNQDTLGPWSRGAFAFRATGVPNGPVSISPSSGGGMSVTFSAVFGDSAGYSDVSGANILVASTLSTQNACWVRYVGSNQSLYLENDSGSALLGPVKAGASSSVSNSQCTLNGLGSSVSGSGDTLTVQPDVNFTAAFSGAKTLYMYSQTKENVSSGWASYGSWMP